MSHSIHLVLALFSFAANSFFCRYALADGAIDPGSFTFIRLVSGALTLAIILRLRGQLNVAFVRDKLSWWSGMALFGYAICFSFAYTQLSTGTGALILFGIVQLSLVTFHVLSGNRLSWLELSGIGIAISGFALLMLPAAQTPSFTAALLMVSAGICWAVFTLLGRKTGEASIAITHGFVLASFLAVVFSPFLFSSDSLSWSGIIWAMLSGIFASGFGYILWYQVVKRISVLQASVAQLAVPVMAFVAGAFGLGESVTFTAVLSSLLVLGGIALTFVAKNNN